LEGKEAEVNGELTRLVDEHSQKMAEEVRQKEALRVELHEAKNSLADLKETESRDVAAVIALQDETKTDKSKTAHKVAVLRRALHNESAKAAAAIKSLTQAKVVIEGELAAAKQRTKELEESVTVLEGKEAEVKEDLTRMVEEHAQEMAEERNQREAVSMELHLTKNSLADLAARKSRDEAARTKEEEVAVRAKTAARNQLRLPDACQRIRLKTLKRKLVDERQQKEALQMVLQQVKNRGEMHSKLLCRVVSLEFRKTRDEASLIALQEELDTCEREFKDQASMQGTLYEAANVIFRL
jgi:hypothetical protein